MIYRHQTTSFLNSVNWKTDTYNQNIENIITIDIEASNGLLLAQTVISIEDYKKIPKGEFPFHKYPKLKFSENVTSERLKEIVDNMSQPIDVTYHIQLAIESGCDIHVLLLRTWDEFEKAWKEIEESAKLGAVRGVENLSARKLAKKLENTKLNIHAWIHNLSYEFQHMRNIWNYAFSQHEIYKDELEGSVFARSPRKPFRVRLEHDNMTTVLHDTYCLTQKSLEAWCKDENLQVKKLVEPEGFHDKIFTPNSKLSQERIDYCVNDVVSMVYGLQKYRSKYGKITDIPMTQTGEVRRKCEEKIGKANKKWSDKCRKITQNYSPQDIHRLMRLFQGGYTHANILFVNKLLRNVSGFDFRSSYPAVMCTEKFPISEFKDMSEQEWLEASKVHPRESSIRFECELEFINLTSKKYNSMWPSSKTDYISEDSVFDNGKIMYTAKMRTIMTDCDWYTFQQMYAYESVKFISAKQCEADYLPAEFLNLILSYYQYKTSKKGIKEAASLYAESKQFINSIYGCAVTKIITDTIDFEFGWTKKAPDIFDVLEQLQNAGNSRKSAWTTYQIGVWVTAWARFALFEAIIVHDKKIAYCDTDSAKGKFDEADLKWFDEYNEKVWKKAERIANARNLDIELFRPKTKKGVSKELGYFDFEAVYDEFKTLGAKRYAISEYVTEDEAKGEKIVGEAYYVEDTTGLTVCGTMLMKGKNVSVVKENVAGAIKVYKIIQTTIAGLPKKAGIEKFNAVDEFKEKVKWNINESKKLVSHYLEDIPQATWIDEDGVEYVSHDKFGLALIPTEFDMGTMSKLMALAKASQDPTLIDNRTTLGVIKEVSSNYIRDYINHLSETERKQVQKANNKPLDFI